MENRIRKEWIDALRALAIVLVVLGHQLRGVAEYFIFTSPIKMPLFCLSFYAEIIFLS